MMTGQTQIRQTFAYHWRQFYQDDDAAWLIKGDFDHFKLTNDLYGALITDYLLDWTLEVIEAELGAHQARWGCGEILCSVIGDDLTIYIPPSTLKVDDIAQMLWKTRAAIEESFLGRYMVGTLPLSANFFAEVAPGLLECLRSDLEAMDVVFDFAMRERGYLLLFPVDLDGRFDCILQRISRFIERWCGKPVSPAVLQLNWICNPENQMRCTFNQGYIDPPTVSFAACPVMTSVGGTGQRNGITAYEQISSTCEAALKTCKQQRKGVQVERINLLLELPLRTAPFSALSASSDLHWYSERRLRESLFFKQLDQPILFQFNPVYRLPHNMPTDILQVEKYRGNQYGIGLKGINEILGQHAADRLIWQLISIFSKVIVSALLGKGLRPESVSIAQFVDRFTVFCEQPIFDLPEIEEIVRCLAALFNSVSEEIKISHLRTSVVLSETPAAGYQLFNQLALTSLSSRSSILIDSDPPIEVRKNGKDALLEGLTAFERTAFISAGLLAERNKCILQPAFSFCYR